MKAAQYIDTLSARGRYHFTTQDAASTLGTSLIATRASLRRLKHKGHIATPYRGFHVIVPPEYRNLGCLPADHFIGQLMNYIGLPYYVSLLSAARYHGAAHHQPQVFQVMVQKNRPQLSCGGVRVAFVARGNAGVIPTVSLNSPRGPFLVSSPAATAFDLVGYAKHAGGLDNVATVLVELAEMMDSSDLEFTAALSPIPWAQRLGYLFSLVGANGHADALDRHVTRSSPESTPLDPGGKRTDAVRDLRWKLWVNVEVEPDL